MFPHQGGKLNMTIFRTHEAALEGERIAVCGICGIVQTDSTGRVDLRVLKEMNQRLVHRGPDDDGFYVEHNVGLAMRRLSIIDLHTGKQPISNEDGTIWIVYNGEIYNHLHCAELQSRS